MSGYQDISRIVAFGRHLPLHKIMRRIGLTLRRRVSDHWPSLACTPAAPAPALSDAAPMPLPLFAPRPSRLELVNGEIVFNCLGRSRVVGHMRGRARIDWHVAGRDRDAQLWLMNLHYMEYLEQAGDDVFVALVSDWITHNEPQRRGAWRHAWNSYATSIRTVIWMQQLARRSARLDRSFRTAAHASLVQQIRHLVRNLETDIGGNHLIKNIKALTLASATFAGSEATRWKELSLRLLVRELATQILQDGMHYERSPSYHCQVLADLLEIRAAMNGDPTGGILDDALHRMAQVAADLTHPDGYVALLNDSGLRMAYPPAACLDAYHALFGARPQPRRLFALSAAGYFGRRTTDDYMVVDCGRLGPDDLPAHAHGDALSFEWSVGGRRVIVDQGVFQYSAGPRRQAARSAASHNTMSIETTDQADFFGAFRCGRRPRVELRLWEPRPDGFVLEGAHDGFRHLSGKPVHSRRFDVTADRMVIRDRIEGELRVGATLRFLLHPDTDVSCAGDGAVVRFPGGAIKVASSSRARIENAVWWPDLGEEHATNRLIIDVPADRAVTTVLTLSRNPVS